MIGEYAWWQWLMYFYVYCFFGWIWESAYVSVKKRRFVNRGFLHLPLLPLYGSGAVVVLFVTLPFKNHLILLYLAGMVGATCLEMVTGLSMEALYKVKYWDYSKCFLNFKGVICLKASLMWGVFSVAMVKFAHEPVAALLSGIPRPVVYGSEAVITVAFAADFYVSNRQALQLAHIISAMEKAKEEMQEDLARMEEEMAEQRRVLEQHMAAARERAEDQAVELIREAMTRTEEARQRMEENRQRMEENRQRMAESAELHREEAKLRLSEIRRERDRKLEEARHLPEHVVEEARLNALFRSEELQELYRIRREEYLQRQEEMLEKAGQASRSMMLRNPTAGISRHREISETLREKAEQWMEGKKAKMSDSIL